MGSTPSASISFVPWNSSAYRSTTPCSYLSFFCFAYGLVCFFGDVRTRTFFYLSFMDFFCLASWFSLVGVCFGLSDLDVVGIVVEASVLITSRVVASETTSLALTVLARLGSGIFSRISFYFILGNSLNTGLATKSSQNARLISDRQ